jgi:cell division protease FtsH
VAQTIDEEVKSLIDTAYKAARTVLTEHRDKLTKLSQHLIEHETIEGDELNSLFGPPTSPPVPDPAPAG